MTPEAKKLHGRLVASYWDLYVAREYARLIIDMDLHNKHDGQNNTYLLKGLNTALIVSYARPFTRNFDPEKMVRKLPDRFLDDYCDDWRSMHAQILCLRNQDFAHSDPSSQDIKYHSDDPVLGITTRATDAPLAVGQVEKLLSMMDHLVRIIAKEKSLLEQDGHD